MNGGDAILVNSPAVQDDELDKPARLSKWKIEMEKEKNEMLADEYEDILPHGILLRSPWSSWWTACVWQAPSECSRRHGVWGSDILQTRGSYHPTALESNRRISVLHLDPRSHCPGVRK